MASKIDWSDVDLVVFDVDGTLYDQRPLRMRMAYDLLKSFDLAAAATIFVYRRTREELGRAGDPQFLTRQFELVAAKLRMSVGEVENVIREWIEERPLIHIAQAAIPGTSELFSSLRRSGRGIAIFSDYPAASKVAALGLSADLVVSATDPDVARLKPDPAGLRKIFDLTGVSPTRTVMIGDRAEKDGAAASSAGVRCILRGRAAACAPYPNFRTFRDEIFAPVLRPLQQMPLAWTGA